MGKQVSFSVTPQDLDDAASQMGDAGDKWHTIYIDINKEESIEDTAFGLIGLLWKLPSLYTVAQMRMGGYAGQAQGSLHTCAEALKKTADNYRVADHASAARVNSVGN